MWFCYRGLPYYSWNPRVNPQHYKQTNNKDPPTIAITTNTSVYTRVFCLFLWLRVESFGLASHPYGARPPHTMKGQWECGLEKVGPVKCRFPSTSKACIIPVSCIIQQACFEHSSLSSSAHQNWMHSSICLTNICLTTVSSRMNKAESLLDVSLVGASLEKKSSSHTCSLSCTSVISELHTLMKSLEDCICSAGNAILFFLCPLF